MVLPTYKIAPEHLATIRRYTRELGLALPAPLYCITISLAGSVVPDVTERNECMPSRLV